MKERDKIVYLLNTNELENIQLALELCKATDNAILGEVCDFFIQSFGVQTNFSNEIRLFLSSYLEKYPDKKLGFNWYDTSLEDCPLREDLPESIGALKHLKYLDLSFLDLRMLPENFSNLESLENLNLSGNRFEEIPYILRKLPCLNKLNLSYNYIEKLDYFYGEQIEELNLEFNKIENIENYFFQGLPKLAKFNLKGNLLFDHKKKKLKKDFPNCEFEIDEIACPNIFDIATNFILDENVFYIWLIKWSLSKPPINNSPIHNIARNFVSKIISGNNAYFGFESIEIKKHDNGIIFWSEIDEKYLLVIVHQKNIKQFEEIRLEIEKYSDDKNLLFTAAYFKSKKEEEGSVKNLSEKRYKILVLYDFGWRAVRVG